MRPHCCIEKWFVSDASDVGDDPRYDGVTCMDCLYYGEECGLGGYLHSCMAFCRVPVKTGRACGVTQWTHPCMFFAKNGVSYSVYGYEG